MKYIFIFSFLTLLLYAQNSDVNNSTAKNNAPQDVILETADEHSIIEVKDSSGLSDDEVRAIAKTKDEEEKESLVEPDKARDTKSQIDLSKTQKKWEELSPHPEKDDWIQTKSGEWFRGEIKALYDGDLEFDSDELGFHTFSFSSIVQIKSYQIISVNIENLASFAGILRLKGDKLTVIQGNIEYEFDRKDLVSFAPDEKLERNYWSGKVTISLDLRSGNTDQLDYSAKVNLKRRTAASRLTLDYLGRITSQENEETANDHRVNEKYDIYLNRNFFWTPLFSEYYTDKYKNIDNQFTAGFGIGYTLIDTKKTEWSLSGGPALLYTEYYTVTDSKNKDTISASLELSTHYEFEVTKMTDIEYDYKLTYSDKNAGRYKHHMVLTLENALTSWLDLDVTGVWDYILAPEEASDGISPEKSDFQLLVGLGVEF